MENGKIERDFLDTISNLEALLKEERNHGDRTHKALEDSNNKTHLISSQIKEEQDFCSKVQHALDECNRKNDSLKHE